MLPPSIYMHISINWIDFYLVANDVPLITVSDYGGDVNWVPTIANNFPPLDSLLGLAINCRLQFVVHDNCCIWIGRSSIKVICGCVKLYGNRWRRLVLEINPVEVRKALNKGHKRIFFKGTSGYWRENSLQAHLPSRQIGAYQ